MGNCLKIQLKESVNNSSLVKLNEISFDLVNNCRVAFGFFRSTYIYSPNAEFTCDGSSYQMNTRISVSAGEHEINMSADGTFCIEDKYAIQWIIPIPTTTNYFITIPKLESLKYCVNITKLYGAYRGNINDLFLMQNLQTFDAKSNVSEQNLLEGNISSFANLPLLSSIELKNTSLVSGNIEDLAVLTSLGNFIFTNVPNISGVLENYVAKRIKAKPSVVSGRLNINYSVYDNIYFKGEIVLEFLPGDPLITWDVNASDGRYTDIAFGTAETTININTSTGEWSYVNQDKSKYTG